MNDVIQILKLIEKAGYIYKTGDMSAYLPGEVLNSKGALKAKIARAFEKKGLIESFAIVENYTTRGAFGRGHHETKTKVHAGFRLTERGNKFLQEITK